MRQQLELIFNNKEEFIKLIKELHKSSFLNIEYLSENLFNRSHLNSQDKKNIIKELNAIIDFKKLSKNKNIEWDKNLLLDYREKINWEESQLYSSIEAKINSEFIIEFKNKLNWRYFGRYSIKRRDVSVQLLLENKSNLCYLPTIDEDLDVDHEFMTICGSYYSKRDSIFNNPDIPWHLSEYKNPFKKEITSYLNFLNEFKREYTSTSIGFFLDEMDINMFDNDNFNDLPF
jgi:hypothetical protein